MSSVVKLALILLAAAALALLARAWFISQQHTSPGLDTVRVRVTAAALPPGLLLRENDMGWKAYPTSEVPKGALTEGSPDADLHGALLRDRKEADAPILASDIIRPDAPGFLAAVLKPGMRAVSVSVDDVSGNAGLIQPGDFVDIILTQRLSQASNGSAQVVSETVVERVRVIAVGSSFQRNAEDEKPNRARTVTFEVAPGSAEAITVAVQLGTLSMALRSFAVQERETHADEQAATASVVAWKSSDKQHNLPVWGDQVSRALGGAPAKGEKVKETSPRRVIILRGSQRQEQEFGNYAR